MFSLGGRGGQWHGRTHRWRKAPILWVDDARTIGAPAEPLTCAVLSTSVFCAACDGNVWAFVTRRVDEAAHALGPCEDGTSFWAILITLNASAQRGIVVGPKASDGALARHSTAMLFPAGDIYKACIPEVVDWLGLYRRQCYPLWPHFGVI